MPYIPELIARKVAGAEKSVLKDTDVTFHQQEYDRLCSELEKASQSSHLPEAPSVKAALSDLLVRLRMV